MRRMSPLRRLLSIALVCAAGTAASAGPRTALLTTLDGDAVVVRDGVKLAAVEGLALEGGDILVTGAQTRLLRIEYPNGLALALGPESQALLEPHLDDETAYLLAGWAKLNVPKGVTTRLGGPGLEITATGAAAAVTALQASAQRVFAESGTLDVKSRPAGAAAVTLATGQMVTLDGAGAKPEVAPRATPALVQAMPRAFMDSLPSRAAAFQGKDVVPKALGPIAYADAEPWIDAEPALRRGFVKRWHALAKDAEFRRGLVAGLKAHPEWEPVLNPPRPASDAAHR